MSCHAAKSIRTLIAPVIMLLLAAALLMPTQLMAQSGSSAAPVFVVPGDSTTVALQTQTTEIALFTSGNSVLAQVTSLFRLRNEGPSPTLLTVLLTAPTATGVAALPADLAATSAGAPLSLQGVEGGSQGLVTVPAGSRLDIRLIYTLNLGDAAILQVRYPAAELAKWVGSTSFRLAISTPPEIAEESWLNTAPSDWQYAVSDAPDVTAIRWLYEGNIPREPFLLDFVNPGLWGQIANLRSAAQAGGVAEKAALGDLYAQLATQAQTAAVKERFYGQALAAYGSALDQGAAGGALPTDLARVYAGQARLFRERIVASGGVSAEYARLLTEAGLKALETLPADSPQRSELEQWLRDGLTLVLADARARRDWESALDTLDRMEQGAGAAGTSLSAEAIAEERKRILFEQSLQLLEEGQRDAAVAVSGAGIVDAELQPQANAQSLFASWQNTITVGSNGTTLHLVGLPAPGKESAAAAAAQELADAWTESAANSTGSVQFTRDPQPQGTEAMHFHIELPAGATGLALANSTPLRPDWALVRTILTQLAPEISGDATFLRRNVLLRLPLDLRTAGEQWLRIANDLEAQAQLLDAQSNPSDRSNAAALESALTSRVKAANFRAEANNWHSLVNNSQVIAQLEGPRGAPGDARAWQVTVQDPPQTLQFATWGVNLGGVLALVAAALFVILLLAAILWSLL